MADVRMVHRLHAETRIARHAETRIEEILIVGVVRKVADQTARRHEVILIVDRLVTGTVVAIADPADLRTWITDVDLRKVVTLSADRIAMQNVVRQRVATSLATEDVRLAAAEAAEALVLRCEAVDRRSLVADPVRVDRRGLSAVSHLVAGHRLVAADQADLKWDRRG